jgi:hypothetical protein
MFQPVRPLMIVCSPLCASKYAEAKGKKKEEREKLIQEIDDKLWKIRKKEIKEEIKPKKEYEKILEGEINTIVRLIDRGHPCISSGADKYIVNAGHLRSVKAFPELRYNLMNIFAQRVHDNQYIGGNPIEYREGLKKTFGYEIYEEIECLPAKFKYLDLTIPELKEKIKLARKIVRELKKETEGEVKPFTVEQRIEKRRELNKRLNIYE